MMRTVIDRLVRKGMDITSIPNYIRDLAYIISFNNLSSLQGLNRRRSILENISTLYTEKIRLDTIEKSGEITANLALRPASLKIAQGSKKQIKITYIVKSMFSEEVKEE